MRHIVLLLFFLILSSPAYSVSFDCAKAKNKIEKKICTNHSLGELDSQLSVVYKSLKSNLSSYATNKLIAHQVHWVKQLSVECEE
jgi:uncharacterized protein